MRAVALIAALLPLPALAQQVRPCAGEFGASAWALAEPWEENTRTFANGAVRLALADTIEPAAGAFHLIVLSPPYDEVGGRQCRIVGWTDGMGFAGADFGTVWAEYDPQTGLDMHLRVDIFRPATGDFAPAVLGIVLNQTTGDVDAYLEASGG